MGVKISLRNRVIKINGVTKFKKVKHRVIFDRIELGTYLIAGNIGKSLELKDINPKVIKTDQCLKNGS